MDWDKIITAYKMVKEGNANRIDGEGWTVYKVNNIIRIDVKVTP